MLNDSKKQKIAWLTPTGIQFPNGPWVSDMEISSSLGLKKTLKLARGKENLASRIFGGFFNPWEEEISIPETRPIRKSYICA